VEYVRLKHTLVEILIHGIIRRNQLIRSAGGGIVCGDRFCQALKALLYPLVTGLEL
jgi:hypothetical protein